MTYDMNILGDITQPVPSLDVDGTMNTGIVKMAQRFLILLLTNVEEDPFGRGTRIPELTGASNVDIGFLEGLYTTAAADVKEQMEATYTDTTPDEEKLQAAEIDTNRLESDEIQVVITLTAVSGDTVPLELPVLFEDIEEVS